MHRWSRGVALLILLLLAAAVTAAAPRGGSVTTGAGAELDEPKLVALTFDDGPKGKWTTQLLDGLAERGAKATFFLIGAQLAEDPEKAVRMVREGHQVGIHTYDHLSALTGLTRAQFDAQVDRTRQLLSGILGRDDFLLRPPYGAIDDNVRRWAQAPLVLWSVDSEDWKLQDADRVAQGILDVVEDGDIILMHDIFPESVEAALKVVDALHGQGYYFVTVSQLFEERGITLEHGTAYFSAHSMG